MRNTNTHTSFHCECGELQFENFLREISVSTVMWCVCVCLCVRWIYKWTHTRGAPDSTVSPSVTSLNLNGLCFTQQEADSSSLVEDMLLMDRKRELGQGGLYIGSFREWGRRGEVKGEKKIRRCEEKRWTLARSEQILCHSREMKYLTRKQQGNIFQIWNSLWWC